jgi:medium-chain acyl-[acyl-carrier-protein] hydrolase
MRLFCFPYAGGNASIYRNWARAVPAEVEIVPVELPGRGNRITEPALRSLPSLISELAAAVSPHLGREFAFFGHSMGAVIAFELARELRRREGAEPRCLFVSGRRAPQIPDTAPTYALPDPEFKGELHRLNGTPKEVLENEELMTLVLPLLRADFELIQTYRYDSSSPPLNCAIAVYGGTLDHEVPPEMLWPWKELTTAGFSLHLLAGDHFFLRSHEAELLKLVREELLRAATRLT